MTDRELLSLGAEKIRRDPKFLEQYIEIFEREFGKTPDCVGCSFKNDFNKLKQKINDNEILTKNGTMSNYKINPRQRMVIHTYINEKGKAIRSYGRNMTDEFAENFLTHGTPEQIAERIKLFDVIPQKEPEVVLNDLKRKDLEKIAKDLGIEDPSPKAFSNKKLLIAEIEKVKNNE